MNNNINPEQRIMPRIPVSVGELIDKITILEIKQALITNPEKLANVNTELTLLLAEWARVQEALPTAGAGAVIASLHRALRDVNTELWHTEDFKRAAERAQDFGSEFVAAARNVYIKNDHRAELKRAINHAACSALQEEKSYTVTDNTYKTH